MYQAAIYLSSCFVTTQQQDQPPTNQPTNDTSCIKHCNARVTMPQTVHSFLQVATVLN